MIERKIHPPVSNSGKADIPGEITKKIGSGKHAQDSIVWHTILWSFGTGIGVTLVIILWSSFDKDVSFQAQDIKSIWSLFIPIITLALGYIFGKENK
jgi:tellurite resistance protein TehA-like permease